MSLFAEKQRSPENAHDLVAAVHRLSIQELEQIARAERARLTANLIVSAFRAISRGVAAVVRASRRQLAAETSPIRRAATSRAAR